MSTALSIGSYSLSHARLAAISSRAISEKSEAPLVERVWDKVVDFFCGTHREEAKRCLSIIYSRREPNEAKIQAYQRLKLLAGEAYKGEFRDSSHGNSVLCTHREYSFLEGNPKLAWRLCQTKTLSVERSARLEFPLNELRGSGAARVIDDAGDPGSGAYPSTYSVNGDRLETVDGTAVEAARAQQWERFRGVTASLGNDDELASVYLLCGQQVSALVRRNVVRELDDQLGMSGDTTHPERKYGPSGAFAGVSHRLDLLRALKGSERGVDMSRVMTGARQFEVRRGDDGRLHCLLLGIDKASTTYDAPSSQSPAEDSARPFESLDVVLRACIEKDGRISDSMVELWSGTTFYGR
ncbi:MAG TPA: hypothetical protein VL424_00185 [Pararobbsia sp.]|nr:hypothetical protein [Pararobbsia sp.]